MPRSHPSAPLPDEAATLARAREGDKDAYRMIVQGYQDRVYRLVISMVGNTETAEDLTQEVFVKAYFALSSFQGGSTFYTWIFRIASNHCLDYLRKRRLQEVPLDRPVEEDSELTPMAALEAPATETPGADLEKAQGAEPLLGALDPEQRLILTLRELEGYSYEELADALNSSVNTIKSRLNRARGALKTAFEAKYGPAGRPAERNISYDKSVQKGGEKR